MCGGRAAYGFGWFLMKYRDEPLITHGGAIAGFSSVVNLLPTSGWTVAVLSNGKQGGDRQGQAEAIGNAVLDVLAAGEINGQPRQYPRASQQPKGRHNSPRRGRQGSHS